MKAGKTKEREREREREIEIRGGGGGREGERIIKLLNYRST